ncbi:MAG: 4,5-DOPA dioxygenase extradiol [Pseudomonadales bacterium]
MSETGRTNSEHRRMPIVFAGHGSPMNAIEDNPWSRGFTLLRDEVPQPKAILSISAHWFLDGTLLMANAAPETIADFSGFPRALYEIEYPAPGNVDLAKRVRDLIGNQHASLNSDWGLDHGTWSVLRWMYPEADVPVIQLSIDRRMDVREHFRLARSLADLREEGVLIFTSGNIVHNLRDAFARRKENNTKTPDWAQRFDETVKAMLTQRDTDALLSAWSDTSDGRLAHPTPEHWLPLIYAYGASDDRDQARFPNEGFDWGSISMRNVVLG